MYSPAWEQDCCLILWLCIITFTLSSSIIFQLQGDAASSGGKKKTWECQHLSDGGRLVISCRLTWATTDTASCWHLGVLKVLISSGISASAKCEQHLTSRISFKPSTGRWEILIGELSFSTSSCLRVGAISSFSAALEALWRNLCVSYVQWELDRPRRALNRAGLVPGAPSVPSVPSVPGVCAAKYQWK